MAARKRSRSDAGPSAGTSGVWAHASLVVSLVSIVVCGINNSSSDGVVQNMMARIQKCGSELIKPAQAPVAPAQATTKQGTRLQRLTVGLNTSLHALNASSATNAQLERWSTVIYESMSASSRDFHGVDHIFEVSGGGGGEEETEQKDSGVEVDATVRAQRQAVQTISAYFHDTIYYTVDGGLSDEQARLLEGVLMEDHADGSVYLSSNAYKSDNPADVPMAMLLDIFGFRPDQKLNPFGGLNEFLSAALAVRCLQDVLPLEQLFRIAACIEATIPFRKPAAPMVLFNRLMAARNNNRYRLGALTMSDLVVAVQQAQLLANRDVSNFAGDVNAFLSNTWTLMPESNQQIRQNTYRISSFAHSLVKMAGFFENLDPTVIYRSFEGVPSDAKMKSLVERSRANLAVAKTYMNGKLLSISVLAALAEKTGGDSVLSMWVGDPRKPSIVTPKVEDDIEPIPDPSVDLKLDETVFRILRDGRNKASSFDIRNSPLAAFLYGLIGDEGILESVKYAVHPMTSEDAEQLLQSLPRKAVSTIALACSKVVAPTRRDALEQIAMEYSKAAL